MDLSRDVPGYSISPHTDTRHKLVTTLFYLCNTTAWPEAGTQFLVSSEGKEAAHGSGRVKWDDTMTVAKQVRNRSQISPAAPSIFTHPPHAPADVSSAALPSRRVYRRRRRRLKIFLESVSLMLGTGRDKP